MVWAAGAVRSGSVAGFGLLLCVCATALLAGASGPQPQIGSLAPPAPPLLFVPNEAQRDESVRFYAEGSDYGFYFARDRIVISLVRGARAATLQLRFEGANRQAALAPAERSTARVHDLTAPGRPMHLPTYEAVAYRDLWPGIDLVFRGAGGTLKYEFVVHPGASPHSIDLAYRGAQRLTVASSGALLVHTPAGIVRDSAPRTYQRVGSTRVDVASRYTLRGRTSYGFALGAYDRARPVVIDPGLVYSGSSLGVANGIAVDDHGSAYVTGETGGAFPITPGAFDPGPRDCCAGFVAKFSPDGSDLVYSTYVTSHTRVTRPFDIAVDAKGSVYITGDTGEGFPTTSGAYDTTFNGEFDAFVAKLSPDGSRLEYSTFLGGTGYETTWGVAVDGAGAAYVMGNVLSDDFPTTAGAFDRTARPHDTFVAKLDPSGASLEYSTMLWSSSYGVGAGIAVDAAGSAYVTGQEIFEDVVTTPGAFDTEGPGQFEAPDDAFVTKLRPDGSGLAYSTYLGGTGYERGPSIDVDPAGSAHVVGRTDSADFPTTEDALARSLDREPGGFGSDAFVTTLSPDGSALEYSTYLNGTESGVDVAVAPDRGSVVAGFTQSPELPVTAGAADSSLTGRYDAFVARLSAEGALEYASYLGGSDTSGGSPERAVAVATDGDASAYVVGYSLAPDFPSTPGVFSPYTLGSFLAKLATSSAPASVALDPGQSTNTLGQSHCVTATVRDPAGDPAGDVAVVFEVTGANRARATERTNAAGRATFCYSGELPGIDRITAFADFNPENGQRDALGFPAEPRGEAGKRWELPAGCDAKVAGSGTFVAANNDRASLQVSARSTPGTTNGFVRYRDRGPAQPFDLRAEVTHIACDGSGGVILFGLADELPFRVEVGPGGVRVLVDAVYDSGRRPLRNGRLNVR